MGSLLDTQSDIQRRHTKSINLQNGGQSFQGFIFKSKNEVEYLQCLCRNIFSHRNDLRTLILKLRTNYWKNRFHATKVFETNPKNGMAQDDGQWQAVWKDESRIEKFQSQRTALK